jgi:hypothetical protein
MKMKLMTAFVAGAVAIPAMPALGQSSTAPLVIGAPEAPANILRSGTEVHLATRTELHSQRSRVGDRFELEVTQDVTLNGQVVIPQGAIATGEVTRVRHRGMWGRRGILETRLASVRVGDRQIRLSGAAGDRGRAGTAGVVAAVLFVPVVGFLVTGTSAVLPPRSPTVAYTDEDIPVVFAGAPAARPLVIQASAPATPSAGAGDPPSQPDGAPPAPPATPNP